MNGRGGYHTRIGKKVGEKIKDRKKKKKQNTPRLRKGKEEKRRETASNFCFAVEFVYFISFDFFVLFCFYFV